MIIVRRNSGMEMSMKIITLTNETKDNLLQDLLKRSPNQYGQYEEIVDSILLEIKTKGNEAVFSYTKKFDGFEL